MKKVSIQDIAKSLQVSKSTVSLVLNGRGDEKRIRKETQQKILDFAKEQNYSPNHLARGLSRGKSETIGLIVPNISDNFYARIAKRIETKAIHHGYNVVFGSADEDPKREAQLIDIMLNRQIDGLIIASTQQNQKEIKQLKNKEFPFVLIDRHYPDIETTYVIVENSNGIKTTVNHLLKKGRRNIGFVTLESGLEAMEQRLKGYKTAMLEAGVEVNPNWIQKLDYQDYAVQMEPAIQSLTSEQDEVDAIIFATHYLTLSGIRELRKANISIPKQVAVASFDGLDGFDLIDPPVTAISQPVDQMGDTAVELLLKKLDNHTDELIQMELPLDFVIRKSCGE
ncbi:substrate-binding domain-containing protein [Marinifilum sp. N1E240]|uniref:LacI family DNA-binding transcriptional regulator n=1 Tax=Marinifilum sp. N1E240 TaxID=2608082 RepID=UPI00128E3475|nr:LacI family DNA-binding transcriptional regulator [Marinifilum sp. N1E240]MPQ48136.1 substrate-binding domain-containing protein [Marinifilum sp. N1E240]